MGHGSERDRLTKSQLGKRNTEMTKLLSRFYKDESGATAIEYGLIATLIAVAIIAGASFIGTQLNAKFSAIGSTIQTGKAPATP